MKKLLDKYTNDDILRRLVEIYPDQVEAVGGYKKALGQLRKMKPEESGLTILPRKYNTGGKKPDEEIEYTIDFTRWQEWLGMKVVTKTDGLTALCYCLWEMTFHGFTQQPIQRRINNLSKIVYEINAKEKPCED